MKNERFKYLDTVFVEGHTDSLQIKSGRYWTKGNWGLSTDRAITVWKLWSEELELTPTLNELLNHSKENLFSNMFKTKQNIVFFLLFHLNY